MEDLLEKDIFKDFELSRYGPDFTSQDLTLRMQLRRDTVMDTHKHRSLTKTEQNKMFKRKIFNNSYSVNNEIAKIRSLFRNIDARNNLISKRSRRFINNTMPKSDTPPDEFQLKLIKEEMDTFLQNSEEISELKIESADTFKVLPKFNRGHSKLDDTSHSLMKNETTEEVDQEKQNTVDDTCNTALDTIDTGYNNYCSRKNNNLQSLLITLTLSSSHTDEINVDDIENNQQKESQMSVYPQPINDFNTGRKAEIIDALKVASFLNDRRDRNTFIAKKYAAKWTKYVKTRTEKRIKHKRNEAVDKFLNRLTKAKNNIEPAERVKVLVQDSNSYQHRYRVQKHIIALQKAKLEQQNIVIEELKYNKIIEASKESLSCMRDEVRKTYYEIDKHLKPKIKCLTNELNIKEIEEPSLILQCLKVPQFLKRMEARAREREEKHAIIRERRKQLEEEKLRLKHQAELAKAEMDKEEKIQRMKDLKEKRRREKIENIRKKHHAERMRALMVMADLHYERNLTVKYGIRPFKRLIAAKRERIERAKAQHRFQLMKNVFLQWMFHTEDACFERNFIADEHCRKKILRRVFNAFKKNHYNCTLKKQVAEDYYDLYLTQLVFRKFREGIQLFKQEIKLKWTAAVKYHNCNILFKTFTCWRALPAWNALRRDQEARKLKWRQKVMLVLPDYAPPED